MQMYKKFAVVDYGKRLTIFIKSPIIMRLFFMLLTISIHLSVFAFGQNITINKQNELLVSVIKEIKRQTNYNFLYDAVALSDAPRVSVDVTNVSVEQALDECFKGLPLHYVVKGNNVIISRKVSFTNPKTNELQREISGRITDQQGEPLVGVTITVKGTQTATTSNNDGNYHIRIPEGMNTLVFTIVGYEPQEHPIGTSAVLNVSLSESVSDLDEVVVVGYGSQTVREITGAISQIKSESLEKVASANFSHALQGQIAGVNITSSSGAPGQPANIKIRGIGSFSIDAIGPLYVVDGVPFDQTPTFSTDEIESMEVLKDAASASIYGTRASNGVILITTKQGKAGEMRVNLDSYYGITNIRRTIPLVDNTLDWLFINRLRYEAVDEVATGWTALIDNPKGLYYNTDWMSMFQVNNAPIQNHSVRLSGGQKELTYSLVTSYFSQDGLWVNSDYERLSTRANARFTKGRFDANVGLQIAYDKRNNHNTSLPTDAIRLRPFKAPFDPDAEQIPAPGSNAAAISNIARRLKEVNAQNSNDLFFSMGLNYEVFDGFKLRANLGADATNSYRMLYNPSFDLINESTGDIVAGGVSIGSLQNTQNYRRHWITEFMATYEKTFVNHKINLLAAISREQSTREEFLAGKRGFLSNDIRVLDGGAIDPIAGGFKNVNSLEGALGRIQYNYADKYLLSASVRRDGSSRFGAANRYGIFPSVSIGWNIARERFYENWGISSVMNSAKIRASYGTAGNQFISDYLYAAMVYSGNDYILGTSDQQLVLGVTQLDFANNNIKWETSITRNIGLDLLFFNDQLSLTADAYITDKSDMLFPIRIPPSAGAGSGGSVIMNIGDMYNKGYELSMGYRNFKKPFGYTLTAVFAQNVNKVTQTNLESSTIYGDAGGAATDPMTVIKEGYPVGSFFLIPTDGLITTAEELVAYRTVDPNAMVGDLRYIDVNGDGMINDDDRVYMGHGNPKWTLGLNFNPSYKNFDMMVQLYASKGNMVYNAIKSYSYAHKRHVDVLNSWNPANTASDIPTPRGSLSHANYRSRSDYYLEDGSFLRIRNVQLGYTIPKTALSKIAMNSCRVYLAVENPITFTRYTGNDPEVGNDGLLSQGVDGGNIPVTSNYRLGVQLSF